MKHQKLIALANPKSILCKKELRKIKGGIGDDFDVMIGSDDIEPTYKIVDDLDNI